MKSLDSLKSVEVYRRGPSLVASFHRAMPPLIWRFDLERNHSFTLALQGDENEWELGLTSPKGDFHPVAHFVMREDAEEAFVKVEKVLGRSHTGRLGLTLKAVALALGGFILGAALVVILLREGAAEKIRSGNASISSSTVSGNPKLKSGEAVPADEFLQPPSP